MANRKSRHTTGCRAVAAAVLVCVQTYPSVFKLCVVFLLGEGLYAPNRGFERSPQMPDFFNT